MSVDEMIAEEENLASTDRYATGITQVIIWLCKVATCTFCEMYLIILFFSTRELKVWKGLVTTREGSPSHIGLELPRVLMDAIPPTMV